MGTAPARLEDEPLASAPSEGWQDLGRRWGPSFVQNRDRRGAQCLLSGTGLGFAAWRWLEPCCAQRWGTGEAGGVSVRGTGDRRA